MLNKVQKAAFDLIQSDARFIYTLVDMQNNAKNINSNYVMMSIPYIGIFADGAEQWCKKIRLNAPRFNDEEKEYYVKLRQAHKLFEMSYEEYETLLTSIAKNNEYASLTFFVNDILNDGSYIFFNTDSKDVLSNAFNLKKLEQGTFLKKVVSRKLQIVPVIMEQYEK